MHHHHHFQLFMRLLPMFVLLFVIAQRVHALDLVWTNLSGGNWATATDWSPNQVPGANDRAFITNAGTYTVSITSAANVSNLVVGLDKPGGQPKLSVSSTLAVNGGWDIGTNGVVDFSGTLNGAGTVTNRGLFNFYASVLQGTGQFINQPQGTIDSFFGGLRYLYRPLVNYGKFNRDTSAAIIDSLGVITNQPGGVITVGVGGFNGGSSAANVVVNYGTINMQSVNVGGPSTIDAPLFNYGTLNVGISNSGSIYYAYLYRGGTNTGTINLSPNGWLYHQTGTYALEAGTQLLGTGSFIAQNTSEVLFNTPLTTSNQIFCGWSLSSPSVRLNASLNNLNAFNVTTGGRLFITNPAVTLEAKNFSIATASAWVTNAATINANVFQSDNGSFLNSGTINVRSNFNFTGGSFFGYGAGTFNTLSNSVTSVTTGAGKNLYTTRWWNDGTINFSAPDAVWFLGSHLVNQSNGVINLASTALTYNYNIGYTNSLVNLGLVQRSGIGSNPAFDLPTTNHGTVKLLGTILTLGQFTQLGGLTDISDSTIHNARFNILGGELIGAATVQSSPSLNNAATLRPGSPLGTLSVVGPFTNTATGVYQMQIGGNSPTQYDRINVTGDAVLSGTLNVTFTNGFYPTVGNTFTAMVYTARSGTFSAINTPNYQFEIIYTPTNLLLRASNSLPFMTLTVAPATNQLVCNPIRVTASGSDLDGAVTNIEIFINNVLTTSTASNSLNSLAESDYAQLLTFVARGKDDRNGFGFATQQVNVVNFSATNRLFLGGRRTNDFKVCLVGEPGKNYDVYANTNLSTTNWLNIGTMTHENGTWRYVDPATVTNRPQRFYRAKQLP